MGAGSRRSKELSNIVEQGGGVVGHEGRLARIQRIIRGLGPGGMGRAAYLSPSGGPSSLTTADAIPTMAAGAGPPALPSRRAPGRALARGRAAARRRADAARAAAGEGARRAPCPPRAVG